MCHDSVAYGTHPALQIFKVPPVFSHRWLCWSLEKANFVVWKNTLIFWIGIDGSEDETARHIWCLVEELNLLLQELCLLLFILADFLWLFHLSLNWQFWLL